MMRAMLDRAQPDLRQVEHLTDQMPGILPVDEISLAAGAAHRDVINDLIWHRDHLQPPSRMTGLTTRLATRRTPQALLRRRLGQPIRGRRPRRITRVLRQPTLELHHLRLQLSDLALQPPDRRRLLNHERRKLLIGRPPGGHITMFALTDPVPARPEQSLL
jgi:hypothetical protein